MILVGINVYVFFFRGGTSIQDVLKASAIQAQATRDERAEATSSNTAAEPRYFVVRGSMKGQIALSTALEAHELDAQQVHELVQALRDHLDMRRLQPDQHFELHLDTQTRELRKFTYQVSRTKAVEAELQEDGSWIAGLSEAELETRVEQLGGRIDSSLNQAVIKAGGSAALVAMLTDLFSWDINWYTDPREGDEFRIVVEKLFLDEEFQRYGRILAAEYRGDAGRFRAIHFEPQEGQGGYFTAEGRSVRRTLLKTPLHYRRISSRYNLKRFHPVLHRTKGHYGVDYAASRGTPVFAAADGVVSSVGRSGGAGKMVVLKHPGGVTTIYMHLHRFARGLRAGQRIKQRQLIGQVGATGLATGPHLHYAIKIDGRYIDPLKYKAPKGALLSDTERRRFLAELPAHLAQLDRIPIPGR